MSNEQDTKHHFIVTYDAKTKQWSHDTETEEVRFPDGTIWDEVKQEWYQGYIGDGGYDPVDEVISDYFPHAVDALNMLNGLTEGKYPDQVEESVSD
jgi:hypothetical protein